MKVNYEVSQVRDGIAEVTVAARGETDTFDVDVQKLKENHDDPTAELESRVQAAARRLDSEPPEEHGIPASGYGVPAFSSGACRASPTHPAFAPGVPGANLATHSHPGFHFVSLCHRIGSLL